MSEVETKHRTPLRTLRIGTPAPMPFETAGPASERRGPKSQMRPIAPTFASVPDPTSVVNAAATVQCQPPPSTRRLRSPIEEVNEVLRKMEIRELGDVLLYAQRLVASRGKGPDPDVVTAIVAVMSRLFPAYRNTPGVPLPILRGALVEVSRKTLDEALLEAEARGLVKLVPAPAFTPFVERAAGIQDQRRGVLYYCSAPDGGFKAER
ncbi:hypothetical protein [Polyangium aurulentum]|uniref:hypothetical protein n=1 Tax=Polyangium aurulentum TaxID=2567896 RepID=UPI0010ADAAA0|nr:hypothetical protein [Polyangium aurulentum]UQA60217.1 hypothetical protein E8A73_006985 [Polyangium aurulentum]